MSREGTSGIYATEEKLARKWNVPAMVAMRQRTAMEHLERDFGPAVTQELVSRFGERLLHEVRAQLKEAGGWGEASPAVSLDIEKLLTGLGVKSPQKLAEIRAKVEALSGEPAPRYVDTTARPPASAMARYHQVMARELCAGREGRG